MLQSLREETERKSAKIQLSPRRDGREDSLFKEVRVFKVRQTSSPAPSCYYPFQNNYAHKVTIFKLFRGLQLQLSGVCRINLHYNSSFLVLVAECSYRKIIPLRNCQ